MSAPGDHPQPPARVAPRRVLRRTGPLAAAPHGRLRLVQGGLASCDTPPPPEAPTPLPAARTAGLARPVTGHGPPSVIAREAHAMPAPAHTHPEPQAARATVSGSGLPHMTPGLASPLATPCLPPRHAHPETRETAPLIAYLLTALACGIAGLAIGWGLFGTLLAAALAYLTAATAGIAGIALLLSTR